MSPETAPLRHRRRGHWPSAAMMRLVDVVVAGLALLSLAPLMLVLAAAVLVEGGRPVFFSQTRLGRNGRPFRMHKFRKFAATAATAAEGRPLTVADDPRLTRIGALLASTKLDELPQLWNVLKGEMALVGPRPESLHFRDGFAGRYLRILDYKPGIFGPSQTIFRSESALYRGRDDVEDFYRRVVFPLKAEIDLAYFVKRNVVGDIGWIVRGALAVLAGSTHPHEGARLAATAEMCIGAGGFPALQSPIPLPPIPLPPVAASAPRPAIVPVRLAATGPMQRRQRG